MDDDGGYLLMLERRRASVGVAPQVGEESLHVAPRAVKAAELVADGLVVLPTPLVVTSGGVERPHGLARGEENLDGFCAFHNGLRNPGELPHIVSVALSRAAGPQPNDRERERK